MKFTFFVSFIFNISLCQLLTLAFLTVIVAIAWCKPQNATQSPRICVNGVFEENTCVNGVCEEKTCVNGVCEEKTCVNGVCEEETCVNGICGTKGSLGPSIVEARSIDDDEDTPLVYRKRNRIRYSGTRCNDGEGDYDDLDDDDDTFRINGLGSLNSASTSRNRNRKRDRSYLLVYRRLSGRRNNNGEVDFNSLRNSNSINQNQEEENVTTKDTNQEDS